MRLPRFLSRDDFGRDRHPARSQRRVIGALSGLVFAGMMVGINAAPEPVETDMIVSDAPPAAPGAARVVLVASTTTAVTNPAAP